MAALVWLVVVTPLLGATLGMAARRGRSRAMLASIATSALTALLWLALSISLARSPQGTRVYHIALGRWGLAPHLVLEPLVRVDECAVLVGLSAAILTLLSQWVSTTQATGPLALVWMNGALAAVGLLTIAGDLALLLLGWVGLSGAILAAFQCHLDSDGVLLGTVSDAALAFAVITAQAACGSVRIEALELYAKSELVRGGTLAERMGWALCFAVVTRCAQLARVTSEAKRSATVTATLAQLWGVAVGLGAGLVLLRGSRLLVEAPGATAGMLWLSTIAMLATTVWIVGQVEIRYAMAGLLAWQAARALAASVIGPPGTSLFRLLLYAWLSTGWMLCVARGDVDAHQGEGASVVHVGLLIASASLCALPLSGSWFAVRATLASAYHAGYRGYSVVELVSVALAALALGNMAVWPSLTKLRGALHRVVGGEWGPGAFPALLPALGAFLGGLVARPVSDWAAPAITRAGLPASIAVTNVPAWLEVAPILAVSLGLLLAWRVRRVAR